MFQLKSFAKPFKWFFKQLKPQYSSIIYLIPRSNFQGHPERPNSFSTGISDRSVRCNSEISKIECRLFQICSFLILLIFSLWNTYLGLVALKINLCYQIINCFVMIFFSFSDEEETDISRDTSRSKLQSKANVTPSRYSQFMYPYLTLAVNDCFLTYIIRYVVLRLGFKGMKFPPTTVMFLTIAEKWQLPVSFL